MAGGPFTKRDFKILKWAGVLIAVLFVAMWIKGPAVQAPTATVYGATPTSTPRNYSGYTTSPYSSSPAPSAAPALPGETVIVTRVVDGDTFYVGDRKIRVLGIDSCEAETAGGRDATERAQELLTAAGNLVSLTKEPGVETDSFDRELRYVHYTFGSSPSLGVQDFGEFMVGEYHTGLYEGRNDANPTYLAGLREDDQYTGRDCSETPTAEPSNIADVDVDVSDDDDGESRFCRRRWYC